MARKYKRLNYEDRKAIEAMCKQGKRAEEIAEATGMLAADGIYRRRI